MMSGQSGAASLSANCCGASEHRVNLVVFGCESESVYAFLHATPVSKLLSNKKIQSLRSS